MKEKIIIVALLLLAIYLYYQNRKLSHLPHSPSPEPRTVFELGENQEELIADRDTAIREKKEMEQEVLSLSNRLKLKQQETTRKEQEIERMKKEKSQVEIALNEKIKELKKERDELANGNKAVNSVLLTTQKDLREQREKYSKQAKLLDEEQTDNNKLTEKVAELEQQITELQRSKSPIPGEFPSEQPEGFSKSSEEALKASFQEQLREIYALFDLRARGMKEIEFEKLMGVLKEVKKKIK